MVARPPAIEPISTPTKAHWPRTKYVNNLQQNRIRHLDILLETGFYVMGYATLPCGALSGMASYCVACHLPFTRPGATPVRGNNLVQHHSCASEITLRRLHGLSDTVDLSSPTLL